MSPESQQENRESNTITTLAIIGAVYFLSQFAFTREVRKKIIARDGYACVLCGSQSGCNCAHIDHNKSNPRYNHESNGRVLCDEDHYLDHLTREDSNIGLPKAQNRWALNTIWSKLSPEKKQRLPPPPKG